MLRIQIRMIGASAGRLNASCGWGSHSAAVARYKRRRCQRAPDLNAVLARLHSPDPQARVGALHSICPCAVGFSLDERFRGEAQRLHKDAGWRVRAVALHVEHDVCEIDTIEAGLDRSAEQGWRYRDNGLGSQEALAPGHRPVAASVISGSTIPRDAATRPSWLGVRTWCARCSGHVVSVRRDRGNWVLITREVGGAVLGWAKPGSASHLGAEVGGCPEAGAVGDQIEGRGALLYEAACQVDALGGEPRQWRGA